MFPQHPWLSMDPAARRVQKPDAAAALGAHMVRRLRGFAKLSHMKRLALVVMARSLTDKDVSRLRVGVVVVFLSEKCFYPDSSAAGSCSCRVDALEPWRLWHHQVWCMVLLLHVPVLRGW